MSKLIKRIINTIKAPAPAPGSPYNQAVAINDTLFLSGVLGVTNDLKVVPGGAGEEARQALKSIGHILEAAGSSYDHVVKVTIMLNDIDDFGTVNNVYKEFFTKNFPARSTFQVGKLPMGANVEIEVIAGTGELKILSPKL